MEKHGAMRIRVAVHPTPERKIMTTLEIVADRPSAIHTDFVSTDAADLASHMDQCAHSRGRFFTLQTGLQSAHSVVSPRIVTVALIVAICLGLLALA